MTDRHAGYIVALEQNVREDDAEAIVSALKMIKGVVGVTPITATPEVDIAGLRANTQWRERVWELLQETKP